MTHQSPINTLSKGPSIMAPTPASDRRRDSDTADGIRLAVMEKSLENLEKASESMDRKLDKLMEAIRVMELTAVERSELMKRIELEQTAMRRDFTSHVKWEEERATVIQETTTPKETTNITALKTKVIDYTVIAILIIVLFKATAYINTIPAAQQAVQTEKLIIGH